MARKAGFMRKQRGPVICQAVWREGIRRDQLTVHADRGSSMRSKPVAFLLADLGVTKTHSRPYTSTDNPYSEAQFKTLKYQPDFPERFGSIEDARAFLRHFLDWYNHEHRHSGIGLLTPAQRHAREDKIVYQKRQTVLAAFYAQHPERFVCGIPVPLRRSPESCGPELPGEMWINRPHQVVDPACGARKAAGSDRGFVSFLLTHSDRFAAAIAIAAATRPLLRIGDVHRFAARCGGGFH